MNYYISTDGAQRGPFPPEQLPAQGLRPDSLVWAEGMAQWERADRVPALQAVVARSAGAHAGPGVAQAPQPVQPVQAGPAYGPHGPQTGFIPSPGTNPALAEANSKKMVAGLCAIFLGTFGVHKFVLGYTTAGVIMLCVSLFTCFLGAPIMHVIGIVEGIMYLTKSDAEFYQTYMVQKKEWF